MRSAAPAALLLLLALAAAPAALAQSRAEDMGPPIADESGILARDPSELPRAAPERWRDWSPASPPPAELREPLAEVGRAYTARDLRKTLEALYRVLELEPDFPPALHQAGIVHFRLRRYGDAAHCFERYLAVQPERVADTRALGHCYYTLGEYEAALEHYERVLAAEPSDVEARRGHALTHARLGHTERALELLRALVELDPEHGNAHAWIAQLCFDADRLDEALAAALRARELEPFEPRPWFLVAKILFDLGRDEEAEAAHARFRLLAQVDQETRALEARLLYDPRQPGTMSRLVELHRSTGNHDALRGALLRWLRIAPSDVGLRIHVLDLLTEIGDAQGAAEAAQALAVVGAEDPAAWRRLAEHYALTRQRKKQVDAELRHAELLRARER